MHTCTGGRSNNKFLHTEEGHGWMAWIMQFEREQFYGHGVQTDTRHKHTVTAVYIASIKYTRLSSKMLQLHALVELHPLLLNHSVKLSTNVALLSGRFNCIPVVERRRRRPEPKLCLYGAGRLTQACRIHGHDHRHASRTDTFRHANIAASCRMLVITASYTYLWLAHQDHQ
jgi:hypothetical protein